MARRVLVVSPHPDDETDHDVFYGIYLCFLLTEVWSIFWHHERIHAVACLLASGMAILAPSTLGAVFGILAARPYWNGVVTPILMVASALLSGTAWPPQLTSPPQPCSGV